MRCANVPPSRGPQVSQIADSGATNPQRAQYANVPELALALGKPAFIACDTAT